MLEKRSTSSTSEEHAIAVLCDRGNESGRSGLPAYVVPHILRHSTSHPHAEAGVPIWEAANALGMSVAGAGVNLRPPRPRLAEGCSECQITADYEARKAAAIAYAAAQEAHSKAQTALQDRVTGRDAVYSLTEVLPKTQKHL
jgi:hypothetical protein